MRATSMNAPVDLLTLAIEGVRPALADTTMPTKERVSRQIQCNGDRQHEWADVNPFVMSSVPTAAPFSKSVSD
jgi:hypothetical protein